MTYLDKYPNCNGCPVEKYCGTAVSSIKLCHSYKEPSTPTLVLTEYASKKETDYIEERITMWDNVKD